MKRVLLLLLCISATINAQIVDIPDANFKAALIADGVDTNSDGEIQETEALAINALDMSSNNISDLTGILYFTNLTNLACSDNNLSVLDVSGLPNLQYLYCENNLLTSLDINGLVNLLDIFCGSNQLTSLNLESISTLNILYCQDNQITELNFLEGSSYGSIQAGGNQITDLDLSNVFINWGDFAFNPLETVNMKNGYYDYDQTIFIEIFYTSPAFICVDDFELQDAIEDTSGSGYQNVVSTYCSFEPGGEYNAITGELRLDLDNDGCDDMDLSLSNFLIAIDDGVEQGYLSTNPFGEYGTYVQLGNYTITPIMENPEWFNVNPISSMFSFGDYGNLENQDFCLEPNGIHPDVEVTIVPSTTAQPGFDATYQIIYKNLGNQIVSGTIEFLYDEAVLDFVSSSVSVTSQSSGSVTWDYVDLYPFESRSIFVTLNVNSPMESPPVNIDDILTFITTISSDSGDENPNNNQSELQETVIGSFDPNDITCIQGDIVAPEMIGEYLHYNVRFENTGTAAATFVVVRDEIDETMFDLNTFQIIHSSHDMTTRITDNLVEFIFDDINLEPEGMGNVVFKIKTRGNLNIGDSVAQQANIYFDFNFPIETNVATTSFQVLSIDGYTKDQSIQLYPNPAMDQITIEGQTKVESVHIYDIHGRKMFSEVYGNSNITLDVSGYNNGIYFVEINSVKGTSVEKLIIK